MTKKFLILTILGWFKARTVSDSEKIFSMSSEFSNPPASVILIATFSFVFLWTPKYTLPNPPSPMI